MAWGRPRAGPLRGEAVGMARSAKGLRGVGAPAASTYLSDGGPRSKTAGGQGPRAPREGFPGPPGQAAGVGDPRREEEVLNSEDTGGLHGEPPYKPQNWSRTDREKQEAGEEPPQEPEPEKEERLGQGAGPTCLCPGGTGLPLDPEPVSELLT